jgi:hypothetical protein
MRAPPADPPRVSGWALAAASAAVLGVGAWWGAAAAPDPTASSPAVGVPQPVDGPPAVDRDGPDGPPARGVPWQVSEPLAAGASVSWQGMTPGAAYTLWFTCDGRSELEIRMAAAEARVERQRYACRPEVTAVTFEAGPGGWVRVYKLESPATVSVQLAPV